MNPLKRPNPSGESLEHSLRPRRLDRSHLARKIDFSYTVMRDHTTILCTEDELYDIKQDIYKPPEIFELSMEDKKELWTITDRNISPDDLAMWVKQTFDPNNNWKLSSENVEPIEECEEDTNNQEENEIISPTRSYAMELYKQKYTNKYICSTLNIKPNTLRTWIKRDKKGKLPIFKKDKKTYHYQEEYLEALELFMSNPKKVCTSLKEIQTYLRQKIRKFGDGPSLSTVHRMLKKLSFSRKRIRPLYKNKNTTEQINQRRIRCFDLALYIKQANKKIVYIDETGFNQNLIPIYGYSKLGKRAYFNSRPQGENHSVIAAICENKLIGFQIFLGSVTNQEFGSFMLLLLQSYPDMVSNRDDYVFFMDNAKIHKAINLQPLLAQLFIHFNVAYCPFLNPIEEMFGLWKHYYRKLNASSSKDVVELICMSAKYLTEDKIKSFYIHSMKYVYLSILGKKIE